MKRPHGKSEDESASRYLRIGRSSGKRDIVFVLCLAVLSIGLAFWPTGYESRQQDYGTSRVRGRVVQVDDSDLQQFGLVKAGSQTLTVRILTGPHAGREITAFNQLLGKMDLDEIYREGDDVLIEYAEENGEITAANVRGRYRLRTELFLMALFALLLVAVAGWTGCKALLSFVFATLMIWKVMLPLFLKGYDPVLVALGVVACLTGAICLLVGGLTRKGLVAFLGGFLGLLLTAGLALLFWRGFRVHGAVRPFSETLLYSGFGHLDLTRIYLAGIFVAASGAVMDLAMDIAAAVDEIAEKRPDIPPRALMTSGLRVGRAVIGTMTTTLLLAYSASYMNMLMLFMAQGIPLANILNHNYVAAQILHTLVGSFGLVTVAPFTALVGGFVYARGNTA